MNAQPRLHQRAREIEPHGTVNHLLPLDLEEPVRLEGQVLRTNEMQVWFLSEHLVGMPLVHAQEPAAAGVA
jgi:hypothetical protein